MVSRKNTEENEKTTEEKIKQAAHTVFHKKGFSATRTRDIAEEAGINLALLNYYFRSKQKLFDLIMTETIHEFFLSISTVINDSSTTLRTKIEIFVGRYIDFLIQQPEIPLFIFGEIQRNPESLLQQMNIREILMNSHFVKQYQQAVKEGIIVNMNMMHFIMNIIGLVIFPFIGKPMLNIIIDKYDEEFIQLMNERKKLIPIWMESIMNIKK